MGGPSSPLGTRQEKIRQVHLSRVAEKRALAHLEGAIAPLSVCDSFKKSQRSSFNTNHNIAKSLNYKTFFIAEK